MRLLIPMVEVFRRALANSSPRQKEYLSNLFALAGAALMYSVWQELYESYFQFSFHGTIVIMLSCLSIAAGFNILQGLD